MTDANAHDPAAKPVRGYSVIDDYELRNTPPPPADPAHDTLAGLYGYPTPDPARYDCRTLQERERDEMAVLRLEHESLREAHAYLVRRVEALERTIAAHADVLQVYRLERGV